MERESFTSLPIAKLLNDNFVSIKVDKEEARRCRQGLHDLCTGNAHGSFWERRLLYVHRDCRTWPLCGMNCM